MAVRYCPRCGLILSDLEANYCPNCGYDLRKAAETPEKIYCMKCGKESPASYRFCPGCGYPLIRPAELRHSEAGERPASITAASIICYIFGVLSLISMFLYAIFAGLVEAAVAQGLREIPGLEILQIPIHMLGTLLTILSFLSLVAGILYILAGYFLWQSKRIGGYIAIILSIISIGFSIAMWWWIEPIIHAFSIGLYLIVILLVAIGWTHLR